MHAIMFLIRIGMDLRLKKPARNLVVHPSPSSDHSLAAGFTLIELLVVIIIIGVLAAIALPSFLGQVAKSRQAEAKAYVGSLNRSQQAYFLEKSRFSSNISNLGTGQTSSSSFYDYSVVTTLPQEFTTNKALSKRRDIISYAGVTLKGTSTANEATTIPVLCNALTFNYFSPGGMLIPDGSTTAPYCPVGFSAE
jgi:type IV pilus assembly protein PilA